MCGGSLPLSCFPFPKIRFKKIRQSCRQCPGSPEKLSRSCHARAAFKQPKKKRVRKSQDDGMHSGFYDGESPPKSRNSTRGPTRDNMCPLCFSFLRSAAASRSCPCSSGSEPIVLNLSLFLSLSTPLPPSLSMFLFLSPPSLCLDADESMLARVHSRRHSTHHGSRGTSDCASALGRHMVAASDTG
jgi:hypothetical protein